jgi:hypothetical protein
MLIIDEKIDKELRKLLEIAKLNEYKLNYITIVNILKQLKYSLENISDIISFFNANNIDINYEEFDEENLNNIDDISDKIKPFDQTKINISMKALNLDLIIKRINNKEINLMPDFQRKAGLWNSRQKSRLIESLMLRIPLPAFYFDGSKDDDWLIIDGLQRLTAIKEFFISKTLKLEQLEFITDFNNCGYENLPRTYLRRMEETEMVSYIINPGTPPNVKYNIFKRINTSGIELEPQEIRHALYQGKVTKLLIRLSENENFLKATAFSIRSDRMQDRELILRFLAFRENGADNYKGIIDDFLNETMEIINDYEDDKINTIELQFNKAMELSYEVFGEKAFRKIYSEEDRKNPINRALFELWSVCFSFLTDDEINKVKAYKDKLLLKFVQLMNDKKSNFDSNINSGKMYAVKRRFESVNKVMKEFLS